jgi:nucleoside-diphosphate-sugar epimerase
MTGVLVTGGTGFVLSNLVRRLLDAWPEAEIAVLDLDAGNAMARRFFGEPGLRLHLVAGDVRDAALLRGIAERIAITHVVHGATVTHHPEIERHDPVRYIGVNLEGTVAVLEWLRTQTGLVRLIHISTGAVYGSPQPGTPFDLQSEAGPFDPPELYAVSKYAAELVVRRYAELFNLPACRVRLSDVFGPMERPTNARRSMSLPWHMMRALIDDRPLRVTHRSLQAGGDYISAEDVSQALLRLLTQAHLPYDVFNIAAGQWVSLPEIFAAFVSVAPAFRYEVVSTGDADFDFDPGNRLARYNAYAIARISELGWRPRPLEEQFASYLAWVIGDPEARGPRPPATKEADG